MEKTDPKSGLGIYRVLLIMGGGVEESIKRAGDACDFLERNPGYVPDLIIPSGARTHLSMKFSEAHHIACELRKRKCPYLNRLRLDRMARDTRENGVHVPVMVAREGVKLWEIRLQITAITTGPDHAERVVQLFPRLGLDVVVPHLRQVPQTKAGIAFGFYTRHFDRTAQGPLARLLRASRNHPLLPAELKEIGKN